MRLLLLVPLLLAVALACRQNVTQTCSLAPYNLQLEDQVFCPHSDAQPRALESNGSSCSDLQYCCQSLEQFNGQAAAASVRLVGVRHTFDATTGELLLPANRQVTLEFLKEACVGSLQFLGPSSLNLTITQLRPNSTALLLQRDLVETGTVLNLCHVASIRIRVPPLDPEADSGDGSLRLTALNLCLLGADVDTCGICNGNGVCPTDAPTIAVGQLTTSPPSNVAPPSPLVQRIQQRIAQQSSNVGYASTIGASFVTTVRRAIVPQLVCSSRLGGTDYCFSVFGYTWDGYNATLDGDQCVYVPVARNFFLPEPAYSGQPTVFESPGPGLDGSFGILWDCKTHTRTKLSWTIVSQSIEAPSGLVTNSAVASREVNTCSDDFLNWI